MASVPRAPVLPSRERAAAILEDHWLRILGQDDRRSNPHIDVLANSRQTSIRFCVLTQLLGKLTDPTLDALCLQRGDGRDGKWDPRGFAQKVIVPWNQRNQFILGASNDPYVSNPLRRPRVDDGLDQMSDREQWEKLVWLLTSVQRSGDVNHAQEVFDDLLSALRERLRSLTFAYVVPPRISILQAETLIKRFLAEGSGGDRGLAVTAALFEVFKDRFGIYREIRRGVINAADAAVTAAADIECITTAGEIGLAVEVKERGISDSDIRAAIIKARSVGVRELLLCTRGVMPSEQVAAAETIAGAWASGTSVYLSSLTDFIRITLPLVGAEGIHAFIVNVGAQLDRFSTQPRHRQAWRTTLETL